MTTGSLPPPTFRRLYVQLGSRYALSYNTMLAFAIPAFGAGFIFEQTRFEQAPVDRIVFITLGYFATILPLIIFRRWFPDKPRESRPIAIILIFIFAGLVRGTSLVILAVLFNTGALADNVYRIAGGPLFTLVMLTVCTVLVSNYRRHRDALKRLWEEQKTLKIRSESIRDEIEIQRAQILNQVRSILDPAIAKIRKRLARSEDSTARAIEELRSTVENVVRPLTKRVSETTDAISLVPKLSRVRGTTPLPEKILLGDFFLPLLAAIVITVALIPAVFWIEDPPGAISILAVTFASLYLVLSLARIAFRRVEVPPLIAGLIVTLVYGLSLSSFHLHKVLPFFTSHASDSEIYASQLFAGLMGTAFFYAQLTQLQRAETLKTIQKTIRQLEKLNAWLRSELWLNRRRTASILHGPIQAALYASAIKLSHSESPTAELVREVESDIQSALAQLDKPLEADSFAISEVLGQIKEVWSDAAEITIDLPKDLEESVNQNAQAREAVVEVVREFVNNSIRHGNAARVDVSIKRLDPDRLGIRVSDDGLGPKDNSTAGFGSKLLDELTLSWSIERKSDTTIASAEIVTGRDSL